VWFLLSLDDEATALLRNVENYLPKDAASQPTSTETSATPLSEPQVSRRCVVVVGGGGGAPWGAGAKGGQQTGWEKEPFR
jgi:hypothetical protein